MISTGTKLLAGAAVLTAIAAWAYGVPRGGTLGTTGLISAFVALTLLTSLTIWTRDSNVSSMDPSAATESAAARRAPQASPWPAVGALGGVLLVLGLVTYPVVFIFGVVTVLAAAIEWMVEAWSERASGDATYNDAIRERIASPVELPVLAALAVVVIVYSFSRIMLFLAKSGGPVVFGVVAALVLACGFLFAYRPNIGNHAMASIATVAVVALVAGGVAAALAGEREIRHEETTSVLAAEGRCDTAEETEADRNASQTVGAKANTTAEITLRADGTLTARPLGLRAETDTVVISRSNETNVLFNNESAEARRLVLDMGTRQAVDEATGGTVPGETMPNQLCTALADEDGSQFLSFKLGAASSDDIVYEFFVPGVDGQSISVVVP